MLAASGGRTWEERLERTAPAWKGAFSLVLLTADQVITVRDPWGFRPLSVGRLPQGGHAIASETCALVTLGCTEISEVAPGEMKGFEVEALTWPVLVANVDGVLHAAPSVCPHEDVSLLGGAFDGARVTCPGHAYEFDLTTGRKIYGFVGMGGIVGAATGSWLTQQLVSREWVITENLLPLGALLLLFALPLMSKLQQKSSRSSKQPTMT